MYRDVNRVFHNSFVDYRSWRPQQVADVNANYFRGDHELKIGFGWRKFGVESASVWPGTGQLTLHQRSYPGDGLLLPIIFPDAIRNNEGRYLSVYVGDTISMDRLTLDVGVRLDRSATSALEASRRANPLLPDVLPALSAPAKSNTHTYNVLAPRLGMSYALGEDSDTLVRASYGQFASQLGAGEADFVAGPVAYSYVYYLAVDDNGDGLAQLDEFMIRSSRVIRLRPQRSDGPEHRQPHLVRPLVTPDA